MKLCVSNLRHAMLVGMGWLALQSSVSVAQTTMPFDPQVDGPAYISLVETNGRAIARLRDKGIPVAYLDVDQALTELFAIDLQKNRANWSFPSEMAFIYQVAKGLPARITDWENNPAVRLPDPPAVKPNGVHVQDGGFFTRDGHVHYLCGSYFIKGFPEENGADTPERYKRLGTNNNNLNSHPSEGDTEKTRQTYRRAVEQALRADMSVTHQVNHLGWYRQATPNLWRPIIDAIDGYDNVIGYCIGNENWVPSAAWQIPYAGKMGPAQAWRPDVLAKWQPEWDTDQVRAWKNFLYRKSCGSVGTVNREYGTSFKSFDDIPLPLYRDYRGWNLVPKAVSARQIPDVNGFEPSSDMAAWIACLQKKYSSLDQLNLAYNTRFERWEDLPPPSPINPVMWRDWRDHQPNKALVDLHAAMGYYTDNITWTEETGSRWMLFLKEQFGTIEKLNATCGTSFTDWAVMTPPSASNRLLWIQWNHYAAKYNFQNQLFGEMNQWLRQHTKRLIHVKTGLNVGTLQAVREDLWNGCFDFFGYGHTWTNSGPDHATPSCSLLDLNRGVTGFLPVVNNEDHLIWDYLMAGKDGAWDTNITAEAQNADMIAGRHPHTPDEFRHNLLIMAVHGQYGSQQFTSVPGRGNMDGYSRVYDFHQVLAKSFLDTQRLANEFHLISRGQMHAPVAILFDRDSDVSMSYFGARREYPISKWQQQVMQITDALQPMGVPLRGVSLEQLKKGDLNPEVRVLVVPACNRKDPDVMEALAQVKIPIIWVTPQEARDQVEKLFENHDSRPLKVSARQPVLWDGVTPMLQPALDIKAVRDGNRLLVWVANGQAAPQAVEWSFAAKTNALTELFTMAKTNSLPNRLELKGFDVRLYQVELNND